MKSDTLNYYKKSNRINTPEETREVAERMNLNRYELLALVRNKEGIEKKPLYQQMEAVMSTNQVHNSIGFAQKNCLISTRYEGASTFYKVKPENLNLLLELLNSDQEVGIRWMCRALSESAKRLNGNEVLGIRRLYRGAITEIEPVKEAE